MDLILNRVLGRLSHSWSVLHAGRPASGEAGWICAVTGQEVTSREEGGQSKAKYLRLFFSNSPQERAKALYGWKKGEWMVHWLNRTGWLKGLRTPQAISELTHSLSVKNYIRKKEVEVIITGFRNFQADPPGSFLSWTKHRYLWCIKFSGEHRHKFTFLLHWSFSQS